MSNKIDIKLSRLFARSTFISPAKQTNHPSAILRNKHNHVNDLNNSGHHRLIKYSLDNLRPIRTAEDFEAVDWLHQQTWLHCGIA